jgi:hypothetical protein
MFMLFKEDSNQNIYYAFGASRVNPFIDLKEMCVSIEQFPCGVFDNTSKTPGGPHTSS